MQEHLYKCIVFLFLNYSKKQMSFNHFPIQRGFFKIERIVESGHLIFVLDLFFFAIWICGDGTPANLFV